MLVRLLGGENVLLAWFLVFILAVILGIKNTREQARTDNLGERNSFFLHLHIHTGKQDLLQHPARFLSSLQGMN